MAPCCGAGMLAWSVLLAALIVGAILVVRVIRARRGAGDREVAERRWPH
jgi:hypothetical protein